MASSQSSQVDELIRVQIPTWNQLFGQNSQCECNECESMTGAPAYLAHILHFAENCKTNFNNETPYDVLIKRAPYLPHLPLTCENTNTELPYIRVVLEILEFFAATKHVAGIPPYDMGNDDWKSDYLKISRNAYKILATQCFPFTLPYHQPLELIRTYLSRLKTSYAELIALFNKPGSDNALRQIKEYLALSDEEYSLLTTFKIADTQLSVFQLYGFGNTGDFQSAIFGKSGINEFLQRTGVSYSELIDILTTQYINPATRGVDFIQQLFRTGILDPKILFTELTEIRKMPVDDTFDSVLKVKIQELLQQSNIPDLDAKIFKDWIDANFDGIQNTIVIIPDPTDPCNYINSKFGTIVSSYDATISIPIIDEQFERLYFFIKLSKKTGLKFYELDNLLQPLSNKTKVDLISALYGGKTLMQKLQLTAAQAATFYGNMDAFGKQSNYSHLFLYTALNDINADFRPDAFGEYFTKPVPFQLEGQYNPVLLSVLQILPEQMDALVQYLGMPDAAAVNLSLESISVLYSYALLAKGMNIPVSDLTGILNAFGQPGVLRRWDELNKVFKDADINACLSFIEFCSLINSSGFSIPELLFILGIREAVPGSQISDDAIKLAATSLQQNFANIDQQNPAPKDSETTEIFVKSKLMLIFDKNIAGQLTGLLSGNIIYGLTLPLHPDLLIPDKIKSKVSYDKDSGRITVKGVLTLDDWNEVPVGSDLQNVLQPIFDTPFKFLKDNFAGFMTTDNDRNSLLDRIVVEPTGADVKLTTFYAAFHPFLLKTLKNQVINKQISALIYLDESLTKLVSQPVKEELYLLVSTLASQISVATGYFPQVEMSAFTKLIVSLYKAAVFISRFNLDAREVAHFISAAPEFSSISFKDFTLEQWQRINAYVHLRKYNRSSLFSFVDLFQLDVASLVMPTVINYIVVMTGWQKDELAALIGTFRYSLADFKNEKALFTISRVMHMVNKTGIKGAQLALWAATPTQFDDLASLSLQVKNAVLLQYLESERSNAEAKIEADLLESQRTALVQYILILDEIKSQGITDIETLCGYFLIDLPMTSSMPTTPIRQALSTFLSFMKRSQLGLESVKNLAGMEVGVSPEYIDNEIWEPKSFFRTWQVTMQFLTNPYPYLSYKYLIDKSEPAKSFESRLLKTDIIEPNVEDAYRLYLQELSQTVNLEIAAMYIDDSINVDGDSSSKFVHVIGKTRSFPHTYFYNTKNEAERWSFWQKIPVAIKENDADNNGPSGAHIFFAKLRGRFYLFMPEFITRAENKTYDAGATATTLSTKPVSGLTNQPGYEIKVAVSEYFQGNWGAKQYLRMTGNLDTFKSVKGDISSFFFVHTNSVDSDGKDVLIITLVTVNGSKIINFTFKSINSALFIAKESSALLKPAQGVFYQNLKMKALNYPMPDNNGIPANPIPDILKEAVYEKLISFSPQYLKSLVSIYEQPFFVHDRDRSYYVKTVPIDYKVGYISDEASGVYTLKDFSTAKLMVAALQFPEETSYLPMHATELINKI
jgi:hypothetical protein